MDGTIGLGMQEGHVRTMWGDIWDLRESECVGLSKRWTTPVVHSRFRSEVPMVAAPHRNHPDLRGNSILTSRPLRLGSMTVCAPSASLLDSIIPPGVPRSPYVAINPC